MSIVCAAKKGNEIAIASDSQINFGSLKVRAEYIANHQKIFRYEDGLIGVVGWNAVSDIMKHALKKYRDKMSFNSRLEIFNSMLQLHNIMKDEYYIETKEDEDQPVESSQVQMLIINSAGIFEVSSYREVNEFSSFWAIGSGSRLALGAMHGVYDEKESAVDIVTAGVQAAMAFDDGCGKPLISDRIIIKK